ncbi:hypothetical protein NCC49_002401 [Naganishia albida]|nr:hypothetical protein NCC49_002401 [Naganishia albida]
MRLLTILGLLAFVACVAAWTKEDHEIFDLVSALEGSEGKGTTFYSFLGVPPQAQLKDINRQYRKRSLELHPDKNPNVKDVHARFARLGTITEILRDPTKRTRYDFFFKNGVPKWRGTGYYYSRFRPSIIHVVLFLVLISSVVHYFILRVNHRRDKQRVEYFTRAALARAGGSSSLTSGTATPVTESEPVGDDKESILASIVDQVNNSPEGDATPLISKRQAKIQAREAKRDKTKKNGSATPTASGTATPTAPAVSSRRRKVRVPMVEGAEFSQSLELVVVDGEVYMPEEDHLTPLTSLAQPPSWRSLWPATVYQSLVGRFRATNDTETADASAEEDSEGTDGPTTDIGIGGTRPSKKKPAAGGKLAAMRRRKASMK